MCNQSSEWRSQIKKKMGNILAILLSLLVSANAAVKWRPNMKSFTHSIKQGGCEENREISLFEFTEGPGVITEQWYTGKGCINQDTIIRYYIDDDKTPSIEFNLFMAQGIGYVGKKGKAASTTDSGSSFGTEPKGSKVLNEMRFKRENDLSDFDNYLREQEGKGTKRARDGHTRVRSGSSIKEGNLHTNPLDNLLNEEKGLLEKLAKSKPPMERTSEQCDSDDCDSDEEAEETSSYSDEREDDPGIPWGTRRFGHVSRNGGLYNTFRVPFQKSIYISMISKSSGRYWYNVRGVQNYPVIIGDIELPAEARLKLYKQEDVFLQPFEYITLASSARKSGMLYQVTLNTESDNLFHQEACFRVIADDSNKTQYLSSGTEDLFLGSYYYSGGIFHTEQSGLSFKQEPGRLCAYKFFEDDPFLFSKFFSLTWRCGELLDNECFKSRQQFCSRKYGNKECITEKDRNATAEVDKVNKLKTKPAIVNSYVWTYEW